MSIGLIKAKMFIYLVKEDLKCDDTENEIYNYFKTQAKEM